MGWGLGRPESFSLFLAVRTSSCWDRMFHIARILFFPELSDRHIHTLYFLRRVLWSPFGSCRGLGMVAREP